MKPRFKSAIRRAPFLLGMLLPAALHADTVGLHFCDGGTGSQVSDATADSFANWTDSWQVPQGNFFASGTNASLKGSTTMQVTWNSSNGWGAGAEGTNEQALYHDYLDDGNTGGGIGVKVTVSGLARWLALTEKTSYQIRCYANNDSALAFLPISIRNGGVTGTVLDTKSVSPLGDGNYPPGSPPASGASRGYVDSIDTLTAGTVSLTIPQRAGSIRGTLSAFKITGIGSGPAVDHFESGDGLAQVVNAALAAGQTSVFRAGLDSPTVTGTFSVAATHQIQVIQPSSGFVVQTYELLTLPAATSINLSDFSLSTLPRGTTGHLDVNTAGANPILQLVIDEVVIPSQLFWAGDVAGGVWDVDNISNWSYEGSPSTYLEGDEIVFDNDATGTTTVALDVAVLPYSVTVANDGSHPYSISGSGAINGAASLTKTGLGGLTLGTSNGYSGPTSIQDGSVILASNAALGASSSGTTVFAGASLDLNGSNIGNELLNLNGDGPDGNGVLINTSASEATVSGAITLSSASTIGGTGDITLGAIGGSGASLVKTGSGQITTSSPFSFTGSFTVDEGTWEILAGNSLNSCFESIINDGGILRCVGDNKPFGGGPSAANKITINQGGELNTPSGSCHLGTLIFDGGTLSADSIRTDYANYNLDQSVSTLGTGKTSTIMGGNVTVSKSGGTDFTIGAGDTLIISSKVDGDTYSSDTGLIKAGPGNLVLTAANTYDSPTTVNAGTLTVTGSLRATSAVTVASGATLAGTGSAFGSVTIQAGGILAPGDVDPTSTLAAGSAVIDGTFQCQFDGATSDSLVVTGVLDFSGGGSIELSTLTAPTGPTYLIASANSITGIPAITGTVPSGYSVQSSATEIRLVSDTAGFSGWIGGFGLASGDQGLGTDPDGDDVANGVEYVLGGNPAAGMDVAKLPQATLSGDNMVFAFDRVVSSETPDVVLAFEHGTDLSGWTPISLETANPPQVTITRSGDDLTDHIVVTLPVGSSPFFGRLKVTAP